MLRAGSWLLLAEEVHGDALEPLGGDVRAGIVLEKCLEVPLPRLVFPAPVGPEDPDAFVLGVDRLRAFEILGFQVEDMALYHDAITTLLNEEVRLISSRLSELPPEKVAIMIEEVVPILDRYIMRLHSTKIREFFANVL